MVLNIAVSPEGEEALREAFGENANQAAKEALIIEGYRTGKLGISDVRVLLGLGTRIQAENWLGERGVFWNYGVEDLEADRKTLNELFGVEL